MKLSKITRNCCAIIMAILMSPLSGLANEIPVNGMVSTSTALEDLNRDSMEKNISDFVHESDIKNELIKRGVSAGEVDARLAALSESEMRILSGQVKEARAGGDILITILLIVLIIYFIKRI